MLSLDAMCILTQQGTSRTTLFCIWNKFRCALCSCTSYSHVAGTIVTSCVCLVPVLHCPTNLGAIPSQQEEAHKPSCTLCCPHTWWEKSRTCLSWILTSAILLCSAQWCFQWNWQMWKILVVINSVLEFEFEGIKEWLRMFLNWLHGHLLSIFWDDCWPLVHQLSMLSMWLLDIVIYSSHNPLPSLQIILSVFCQCFLVVFWPILLRLDDQRWRDPNRCQIQHKSHYPYWSLVSPRVQYGLVTCNSWPEVILPFSWFFRWRISLGQSFPSTCLIEYIIPDRPQRTYSLPVGGWGWQGTWILNQDMCIGLSKLTFFNKST